MVQLYENTIQMRNGRKNKFSTLDTALGLLTIEKSMSSQDELPHHNASSFSASNQTIKTKLQPKRAALFMRV